MNAPRSCHRRRTIAAEVSQHSLGGLGIRAVNPHYSIPQQRLRNWDARPEHEIIKLRSQDCLQILRMSRDYCGSSQHVDIVSGAVTSLQPAHVVEAVLEHVQYTASFSSGEDLTHTVDVERIVPGLRETRQRRAAQSTSFRGMAACG